VLYFEIEILEDVIRYVRHKSECKILSTLSEDDREGSRIRINIDMPAVTRRNDGTLDQSTRHSMLKKTKNFWILGEILSSSVSRDSTGVVCIVSERWYS